MSQNLSRGSDTLVIKKLKKESKDGYLVSGLIRGGEDDKRGFNEGKRIGRFIRSHVAADSRLVFHSIRKSFATALENAGVPENTAKQLMGHEKQSLSYGLYSGGVDMKVLTVGITKVGYGKAVADLIR